ncbi:MAG: hypothetical protein WB489_00325, partial [Pseudolabrys sp.]
MIVHSLLAARNGIGLKQILDGVEQSGVSDRCVFADKPFALVTHFAEVRSVLEQIGEGTVSERHRTR